MKYQIFITPTSTQPRFRKRIDGFREAGISVKVFSFRRKHQSVNDFGRDFNTNYIGNIDDGKYFKRIFTLINSFFSLRKKINSNQKIYVFGLDLALFTIVFLKKSNISLEIGDIRIPKNFLLKFLVSRVEMYVFSKIDKLIVTSSAFKGYYIQKNYNLKIDVIENKIDKKDEKYFKFNSNLELKQICSSKITIGVIGMLRYNSLIQFLNYYLNSKIYNILIIGDGKLVDEIKKIAINSDNITYYGAFENPYDLKNIYEAIDVSFVVYDSSDLNVRLALPNKLYESIYFKVPLIVSKNTFLWDEVNDKGIGIGLGLNIEGELMFNLEENLTLNKLKSFKDNMATINRSYYINN